MSDILKNVNTYHLLDKIEENIFITDAEHTIIWVNLHAKNLLKTIGPYVGINNPDQFIGLNVSTFHGERQNKILQDGPFPHSAQIVLFKKFSANIVVDEILTENGKRTGFILSWQDVTEYEDTIKEGKQLLMEIDTPIIPTVHDSTALVPIIGKMTPDRLETIQSKILNYCTTQQIEYIILDFTSFIHDFDMFELDGINKIFKALSLMGVEPVVVGIGPKLAQSILRTRIDINFRPFNSFKQGMQYILDINGYKMLKE
ncbi:STAS domain-containing protein [Peribacillus sp. NPDC097675]|uniref:STAS domain-containing protein n=1 Tax=Peribacillus sp. NPDC097675 TaxID=3390618 RepID=UPI003D0091FB